MIVHLFDDQKFVDITINNFDKINSSINRYIVFSKSNKLKYVHNTDRVFVLNNSSYKIKHEIIFKAKSKDIEDKYKLNTETARKNKVFGSPTFIVEKEIFWGDDRMEDAIRWSKK